MRKNTVSFDSFVFGTAFAALILAAPSAQAFDTEPTWVTNTYFGADAKTTPSATYVNGSWTLNAPQVEASKFAIDSTQTVFTIAADGMTETRKIVRFDCNLSLTDYYFLEDLEADVTSSIASLALVTNETGNTRSWMGMTGGDTWVALTGASVETGDYTARIEVDYTVAATPIVRYSVKTASTDWTVLKDSNNVEWFQTTANADPVSMVCFRGKSDVADFAAKISTTATAEANYKDFETIAAALAEAKASGMEVVLYKDVAMTTPDLKGGLANATYVIQENGKTFSLTQSAWKVSDGTGVEATYGDGTLTVSPEVAFAARIGEGDNAPAYMTVQAAFGAAADGATVTALRDFDESVVLNGSKYIRFDMDGHFGTSHMPSPKSGNYSCVSALGSSQLYVFGGTITNMYTDEAGLIRSALYAGDTAKLWVSDMVVTNNTKDSCEVGNAACSESNAKVVISNGFYVGDCWARNKEGVQILGGIHHWIGTLDEVKVKISGGKFSQKVFEEGFDDKESNLVSGYQFVTIAVPNTFTYQTTVELDEPNFTISKEVMKIVKDKSGNDVATTVYTVSNDGVGGVQIADKWVEDNVSGGTPEAKQADLQSFTSYKGGETMKKWEAFVLGMKSTDTSGGPTVKGLQDDKPGKVGFSILTPETILAAESGCDVKYTVTEYTNPELTEGAGTESAKVDYTQAAELDAPASGVRYYKLKMYITPKK